MFKIAKNLAFGLLLSVGIVGMAQAGSAGNYLINKLLDEVMRGQVYTGPSTIYFALETSIGSPSGCGTEAAYTGYARVGIAASLANFSGTQGAGTTATSSGTSGTTSNNVIITYGAPTSGPTVVVGVCAMDAATGGNLLWRTSLTTSKTLNSGDAAPSFAISALSWTVN